MGGEATWSFAGSPNFGLSLAVSFVSSKYPAPNRRGATDYNDLEFGQPFYSSLREIGCLKIRLARVFTVERKLSTVFQTRGRALGTNTASSDTASTLTGQSAM